MAIKVYADLEFANNAKMILSGVNAFPVSPVNGEMAFKDGVLWIYANIGGTSAWYPVTNSENAYTHEQTVAATTWNVAHNLGSENFVYNVFDDNGNVLYADVDITDANNIVVNLTEASTGHIVVIADAASYGISGTIDFGVL